MHTMREVVAVVEDRYCNSVETELTVHKTSMFSKGDGFLVYDNKGDILFRVDSYGPVKHRLLLMDPFGKPLLTLLPKWPTLHQRWNGFIGDKSAGGQQQPVFSVWKSTIIGRSSVMVEVYSKPPKAYRIEGSFPERRCTISSVCIGHDGSLKYVKMAQIKHKENSRRSDIVFGRDVFSLTLKAGFDGAFAMALVLVLDQIDGDDVACDCCHIYLNV